MMNSIGSYILELLYRVSQCITVFRPGQQAMAIPSAQDRSMRGPTCNVCMMNPGVPMCRIRDRLTTPEQQYVRLHHLRVQILCYDCLQDIFDGRHRRWWQEVFHNHIILADPMIQSRISQYLWSSIYQHPCLCGGCDPFWLSRGWRCWG